MQPLLLFLLLSLACLHLLSCSRNGDGITTIIDTPSGERIQKTTINTWTSNAQINAHQTDTDAWEFHEVCKGDSIVISLHHLDFPLGSFNNSGSSEITLQLPSDVKAGQTISLRAAPENRTTKKVGEYKQLAPMEDGEIIASKTRKPLLGSIKKAKLASAKILEIGHSKVVIHLRLKADLADHFSFDIDRNYTLRITKPPKQ